MKITLQPNETTIDTWSINYMSPDGKIAIGKLTVTSQRLLFLPQHNVDSLSLSIYHKDGMVILSKPDIKEVSTQKNLLSKKVLVTMADNSMHTFHYGILSIDKLVTAIQSN